MTDMLEGLGFDKNIRGEALSIEDYVIISNEMVKKGYL